MKKIILFFFTITIFPFISLAQEDVKEKNKTNSEEKNSKEKPLKVVPLITSTPLMGLGVGGAASYLYKADKSNGSKSQLQIGGQYSNTHSYSLFLKNSAWFNDNKIWSNSQALYSSINNEFTDESGDVSYNINTFIFKQTVMFKLGDQGFYIGAPISYKQIAYTPNNTTGGDFIEKNGIQDERTVGVGLTFAYDTRKNKYYPTDSQFITMTVNSNPSWMGTFDSYYSLVVDARFYQHGFTKNDVWATQFFGQYSSELTPDSGLPSLSGKTILRGFPNGQFKAKHMTGAQTEYRYTIGDSRFRITSFYGIANLSGGSYGWDGNSRDDDGWYQAGGMGLRYALQPKTGVDLRLDFVRTSEQVNAVYLTLNQAF